MESKQLIRIVKIGGNVIDDETALNQFLVDFSQISGPKILVHGGGKAASDQCRQLGIEVKMKDGRRITDKDTMKVVTQVYAGQLNKNIVAQLQAKGCDALGLTGADMNVIPASKRVHPQIDYGYVGDFNPEEINIKSIAILIESNFTPVFCAITHDQKGNLLNTNADTIASGLAIALSDLYETELIYCFDKRGVLNDQNDQDSVIETIDGEYYKQLKSNNIIHSGMIPKLDNAFNAIRQGVQGINIKHASELLNKNGTFLKL